MKGVELDSRGDLPFHPSIGKMIDSLVSKLGHHPRFITSSLVQIKESAQQLIEHKQNKKSIRENSDRSSGKVESLHGKLERLSFSDAKPKPKPKNPLSKLFKGKKKKNKTRRSGL